LNSAFRMPCDRKEENHETYQITTFDAPGAGTGPSQGTLPQQITAAGTIVGNYVDSNFVTHAFVRTVQAEFATIDAPGALRTQALGMMQARVVADYTAHGFVAFPRPLTWWGSCRETILDVLPTFRRWKNTHSHSPHAQHDRSV
jgi:hypothetical protein